MRKLTFIGAWLLFGLVVGVALQPDDGTSVQHGDLDAPSAVAGANHAKPLPRIATPADLLPTLAMAVGLLALVAIARPASVTARLARGRWHTGSRLRALALAQRGPPLFA